MKGTALIYHPGKPTPERIELTETPKLEFMQKAVGGYIELIPAFTTIELDGEIVPCAAFCHEEGKFEGLAPNSVATEIWRKQIEALGHKLRDYLVGPILVITGDDALMREL